MQVVYAAASATSTSSVPYLQRTGLYRIAYSGPVASTTYSINLWTNAASQPASASLVTGSGVYVVTAAGSGTGTASVANMVARGPGVDATTFRASSLPGGGQWLAVFVGDTSTSPVFSRASTGLTFTATLTCTSGACTSGAVATLSSSTTSTFLSFDGSSASSFPGYASGGSYPGVYQITWAYTAAGTYSLALKSGTTALSNALRCPL